MIGSEMYALAIDILAMVTIQCCGINFLKFLGRQQNIHTPFLNITCFLSLMFYLSGIMRRKTVISIRFPLNEETAQENQF